MANQNFDSFVSNLNKTPQSTQVPNAATPAQVITILEKILDAKGIDKNAIENVFSAKAATCVLLQSGAASPKFDPNRSVPVHDLTLDYKTLKKAINDTDTSLTPRKLARALRDEIGMVAQQLEIPGNLSKNYLLDFPNAQISELVWVSDFQTFSNNSSIPTQVREWLLGNYNTRFKKK